MSSDHRCPITCWRMRRCGRTQAHECHFGAKWEQRYCHFVSKAAFPFRSASHFAGNGRLLEPFTVCALSAGRKAFPLRKETPSLELLTFPLRVKTPSPELCTFPLRLETAFLVLLLFLLRKRNALCRSAHTFSRKSFDGIRSWNAW